MATLRWKFATVSAVWFYIHLVLICHTFKFITKKITHLATLPKICFHLQVFLNIFHSTNDKCFSHFFDSHFFTYGNLEFFEMNNSCITLNNSKIIQIGCTIVALRMTELCCVTQFRCSLLLLHFSIKFSLI